MELVPISDNKEEWDNFALQSDDGWFWHTTQYMAYAEQCSSDKLVANPSFKVVDDQGILAICPVMVYRSPVAEEANQFSFGDSAVLPIPIPFPAMRKGLSPGVRKRILTFYVHTLAAMAVNFGVGYVSVRIPCLVRSYLVSSMPLANPLLRYGFMDLGYIRQVIDLNKDKKELWRDIRKGHKYDVTHAGQSCEIKVWDQCTITDEKFRQYQLLHAKDRGGDVRGQKTFDLMLAWVKRGYAVLIEAIYQGRAIGFSLVILFGNGAYYASSCKDPDCSEIAATHFIQWNAICWLKEHGIAWYDLGPLRFHPQWFETPDPRSLSVSKFKRGFGGITLPEITAEYFYSRSLLKQTFENRLQGYLAALSPAQVGR